MAVLTKKKLEEILTKRLRLSHPEFFLKKEGRRIFGSIVSSSFRGKDDLKRLSSIWDALESELGEAAPRQVGTLLAYTPDEWYIDQEIETGRLG